MAKKLDIDRKSPTKLKILDSESEFSSSEEISLASGIDEADAKDLVEIDRLGMLDIFGHHSVIKNEESNHTVVAKTGSVCYVLNSYDFLL